MSNCFLTVRREDAIENSHTQPAVLVWLLACIAAEIGFAAGWWLL